MPPSARGHRGVRRVDGVRADWRRRPIVLVGLMGSGKTTVGKRLAAKLRWPFVDADAEIEVAAQMPISEIFARFGESHFRDGERRVIGRLMEGGHKIIATGGGAFVDAETRALILNEGTAIWLDAAIETLAARVSKRNHRPLLIGKDPKQVLGELMELRAPCYRQAPIHIISADGPHEETVNAILHALIGRDSKAV
ncbi:shikimate kinase [Sandaracinobacter neustonicus]|uniref:Shikimate kinase n=2 Tax=Sandaracinobacter neustonicus TaxID=1715348 RepID=A0A501XF40_9SPHN|nr:shikimate kinase [Sandaracinobacter neustonicus]